MNAMLRKPGVLIGGRFAPSQLIQIARCSEDCGIGQLWIADERFYREVYEQLTVVALSTSQIALGTCVTDPYSRHPALTAVAIATLDEISNGRALLGIGAGISGFDEMGITRRKPVVAIREAISVIRNMLTGDSRDFEGEIVSLRGGHLHFAPFRTDVPIYIASNGELVQKLAGRVANGVIMEACASVGEAAIFIGRIRSAATAAGRDASQVQCIARLNYCVSDDGDAARDALRARVGRNIAGGYMSFADKDPKLRMPEEALALVAGVSYSAGLTPYEALVPYVTDEMVDAIALGGTEQEIIDHVISLRRSGIDNIIISPNPLPGDSIENSIRIFGERIWPAVEEHLGT